MPKLPFAEKAISILQEYCDREYNGSIRAMQTSLGMDPDVPYMNRWLKSFTDKNGRVPRIDSIGPYLDKVGAVLTSPWDTANTATTSHASEDELSKAKERIRQLEAQVQELQQYKVKWETVLELERAKSGWTAPTKKESQTG